MTDNFSPFDPILATIDLAATPWIQGRFIADTALLERLLRLTLGTAQQSRRTANAFDAWIASELRRSGFAPDAVWPRTRQPRALPSDLRPLESAIDEVLAATSEARASALSDRVRRALRALDEQRVASPRTYILGDFYAKEVDVVISSWRRGPEVLVSTKSMFSSYRNNFRNRHEEAVGEVTTLRRRHPMAAMGFAFLARSNVYERDGDYPLLRNILTRLRRPGSAFDATMLLIADWDDRDPGGTLKPLLEPDPQIGAGRFFEDLIAAFTERTPPGEHEEVRTRRDGSPDKGGALEEGATEIADSDEDDELDVIE
jgi:hypothetical protein